MENNLVLIEFSKIDLANPFFDSLKADYSGFGAWFANKGHERAYVYFGDAGEILGFLYLKLEQGPLLDVIPQRPAKKRLKTGTFKIEAHGTRLGERFMKKAFDHAVLEGVQEVYVTVFKRHEGLISLFKEYGFTEQATKETKDGVELVLVRELFRPTGDVVRDFPLIPVSKQRHYLLALYPQWHSRLLPDSLLKTEDASIITDVSHTNSIHKIYLAGMQGIECLNRGDTIVIYRTTDNLGPAHYRSVATTVAVTEEVRNIASFNSREEFLLYTSSYSIFSEEELGQFWGNRKYPWVIRFTYNLALRKRLTRKCLLEEVGLNSKYWGFFEIPRVQFQSLARLAGHDASPLFY